MVDAHQPQTSSPNLAHQPKQFLGSHFVVLCFFFRCVSGRERTSNYATVPCQQAAAFLARLFLGVFQNLWNYFVANANCLAHGRSVSQEVTKPTRGNQLPQRTAPPDTMPGVEQRPN